MVLARELPPLNRIVLAIPRPRSQLLSERPFGSRPIHGDLHRGNVLMCRRVGRNKAILLDWGRARAASPLEDVGSWLQSVSYWEPESRRQHDTLLAAYLAMLGMDRRLTDSVRAAYWMAAASNVLSGALLYHLCNARDCRQASSQRAAAIRAAQDALRVVRRADAWWSWRVVAWISPHPSEAGRNPADHPSLVLNPQALARVAAEVFYTRLLI